MGLSIYISISNIIICLLLYKFITDLISHLNINYFNQELIQRKFLHEFLFGITIFTITYLLVTNGYFNIDKIKYGLYLASALLLFESVFINWNYLSSDTKLILIGTILIIVVSCSIMR